MKILFFSPLKNIIIKLLVLSSILFLSCQKDAAEPQLTINEKLRFDNVKYKNAIGRIFYKGENAALFNDSTFSYIDTLNYYYSKRSLEPLIIESFESSGVVFQLLELISQAKEHGLNPEAYHYSLIKSEFSKAINDTIDNPFRHEQLATAEILLSEAVMKYSYHMRFGSVNPKLLFADSYFIPLPDSASRNIFEPLEQENLPDYLKSIQPSGDKYTKLKEALTQYEQYLNLPWPVISISSGKLEPGDNDPALCSIASRLITLSILDTTINKLSPGCNYDSVFVNAVKKFQRVHGLNEDGIIGKGTLERLNITPEQYVKIIKINLERFRWTDYSNTPRYLLVNIPDFKVYAIEEKRELFNIKVCTGLRRPANYKERFEVYKKTKKLRDKPDDWETPCLYSEISYMVLNPTWTVPASIIREEILREVKKDSNYLHIKNFKVYKDGTEINLDEVDIKEFSSAKIPYTIVQDPGAGNALGKIKFMFNNPFGVYLHDTPTRAPFSKSNRAVSHGCVRVEKPITLADYLLRDHSKWNTEYLKIEIGMKTDDKSVEAEYLRKRSALRKYASFGKTTEIILDRKIPLYIDYYTAWVDSAGDVNFREDVYRKDMILSEYMFSNDNHKGVRTIF